VVGLIVGGAMRFLTAKRWWPGRSLYTATSVLADEAYVDAALRIPWRNRGSGTMHSPAGAVTISLTGASRCQATRATRRRSICAWRERWPERCQRLGAEGPAASAWAGAGASAVGVTGTGPGPVDRHGSSSARLVMHMW
jgi:hypothetical protein